jgi:hypothetical protein
MEATTRLYSSWLDRASECWCVFVRRRFFLAFLSISLKIKATIYSRWGILALLKSFSPSAIFFIDMYH